VALFLTFHNVYVHINVDWGHGPPALVDRLFRAFSPLGTMPMCRRPTARTSPTIFPLFDWMFGTYRVPRTNATQPVGRRLAYRANDVVKLTLWAPCWNGHGWRPPWVDAIRARNRRAGWRAAAAGPG